MSYLDLRVIITKVLIFVLKTYIVGNVRSASARQFLQILKLDVLKKKKKKRKIIFSCILQFYHIKVGYK